MENRWAMARRASGASILSRVGQGLAAALAGMTARGRRSPSGIVFGRILIGTNVGAGLPDTLLASPRIPNGEGVKDYVSH